MSLSAMVYMELYTHLESYSIEKGHSEIVVKAAINACDKLNKYYPTSDGLVYVVGLILDPRSKLTWYSCNPTYFSIELVKEYRGVITKYWNDRYKPANSTPEQNEADQTSEDDLFTSQMKRARFDARDELQIYLSASVISPGSPSMKSGPLGWRKAHENVYPNLSKMAKDFLSASGTGVPVERFFSGGTDLVTPKRQRLNAETIRKTMCIKGWMRSRNNKFKEYASVAIKGKMGGGSD
ncbi:zinc finger BED domain-containing protein DAYSLEEPER-like [Folsomia candida]|uniref:zinc finger BED domain-containing protein DAYSLEEPER-like n=1 Tax=Folsomia candida TaxID=158441 RepID=UPI0016050168|nr:zinc finger BED domain-containing protein DAYSLEEPER-like [Folsomia candida]